MTILLKNATLATMIEGYGLIKEAAVVLSDTEIVWAGAGTDLPAEFADLPSHDLGGRLVTPALIDCHTHIVFGGDRATEFEMRLNGASYEEVARAGGGILSTVTATRAADETALLQQALARADQIIAGGAATIEIKSGYGLTVADELKMLRVARAVGRARAVKGRHLWATGRRGRDLAQRGRAARLGPGGCGFSFHRSAP